MREACAQIAEEIEARHLVLAGQADSCLHWSLHHQQARTAHEIATRIRGIAHV